jgi:hypothetical protein
MGYHDAVEGKWQRDVARHLQTAAEMLTQGHASRARSELGMALGYLIRAAGDGDDDAFELLRTLREGIDEAEPTQRLSWEPKR